MHTVGEALYTTEKEKMINTNVKNVLYTVTSFKMKQICLRAETIHDDDKNIGKICEKQDIIFDSLNILCFFNVS